VTVRYARSGDVNIAYEVFGSGPIDLVYVPGWVSHLETSREQPTTVRFTERMASFTRFIRFDKRGTGMSDRVSAKDLPTLEQRMDDVRAVMDAVGSKRAALFGYSEGGPMSALFAATYPERTTALIMMAAYARRVRGPSYPFGPTPEDHARWMARIESEWGTAFDIESRMPSVAHDETYRQAWAARQQRSASPGAAHALAVMNTAVDVRSILPAIRVPTLVIHKTGDRVLEIGHGRYLAEHIPGARFVELPGDDHVMMDPDVDPLVAEVQEFLTGVRPVLDVDRVLSTVLFTDIVGSTERLIDAGDRRWRDVLKAHHEIVRREIERYRGREVDNAGDGFFATFDGPARAVRCACAIRDSVPELGVETRAGLHTGECEVLGTKVSGVGVHVGARVASVARPSEVLVTRTVRDLVAGSGLRFEDRGAHQLKGIPDPWQLYAASTEGD
jgi:pimeloyl-ACP methyl ester carboxylesterase